MIPHCVWRDSAGGVTGVAKLGRSMLRPYEEEERFLTAHADAFAGANGEEKVGMLRLIS